MSKMTKILKMLKLRPLESYMKLPKETWKKMKKS